jgi:anti-sigma factor RsiW
MPTRPDDCAAALALLEPYLDGELPPAEAERLREHAARCPACAAELRLAQALQGGLRELPELDVPPAVLARVRAAATPEMPVLPFARPAREPAPRSWQPRFAALAAALVLVLLGTLLLFELRSPRASQPARPTPLEVARATAEARYALAYVGRASRRAGLEIKDEVLPEHLVAPAARSLSRSLHAGPDSAPRQGS